MTNIVLIKRSATANAVPTGGQLANGEIAINYADGNLFFKDSGGSVQTLASKKFVSVTGNITGGNVDTGIVSATGNVVAGNLNAAGLSCWWRRQGICHQHQVRHRKAAQHMFHHKILNRGTNTSKNDT
jgi:hypothetical protein